VVANHSWPRGARYQNRARVHLLDGASGRILWSWPKAGDLPEKITWLDAANGAVAFVTHFAEASKAAAPLPAEYPPGTLYVLDTGTGAERTHLTFEPLRPYFAQAECWRGLALRADASAVAGALDDGRVFVLPLGADARASDLRLRALTTPLDIGGAPLLATAGSVAGLGDRFLVATGDTYTPWILRAEDVRPPQPHPNGRTLFCFDFALQLQWLLRLENDVEGLAVAHERPVAAVSLARVVNPAPGDVNGVSVFDLAAPGNGVDKFQYTYSFAGTCPYDTLALSPDGRFIAIVEMPYTPREGGAPVGEAALHVIH
jgi:hypothetical protein